MVTSGTSRQSSRPSSVAGLAASASRSGGWRKRLRDFVGVDRDQADRLFAGERAEPFLDLARGKAIGAGADQIDADEVAVFGAPAVGLRDVQLAAGLLLVDGDETSAAVRVFAEDAERARLRFRDDANDAATIRRAVGLIRLLDTKQGAVADTGGGAGLRPARNHDADLWRGAALFLVPFGGRGEQFAVAVAAGDVGEHGMRQFGRLVHLAAALGDRAFVGELAQQCASARHGRHSSGRTRARSRGCRPCRDGRG